MKRIVFASLTGALFTVMTVTGIAQNGWWRQPDYSGRLGGRLRGDAAKRKGTNSNP